MLAILVCYIPIIWIFIYSACKNTFCKKRYLRKTPIVLNYSETKEIQFIFLKEPFEIAKMVWEKKKHGRESFTENWVKQQISNFKFKDFQLNNVNMIIKILEVFKAYKDLNDKDKEILQNIKKTYQDCGLSWGVNDLARFEINNGDDIFPKVKINVEKLNEFFKSVTNTNQDVSFEKTRIMTILEAEMLGIPKEWNDTSNGICLNDYGYEFSEVYSYTREKRSLNLCCYYEVASGKTFYGYSCWNRFKLCFGNRFKLCFWNRFKLYFERDWKCFKDWNSWKCFKYWNSWKCFNCCFSGDNEKLKHTEGFLRTFFDWFYMRKRILYPGVVIESQMINKLSMKLRFNVNPNNVPLVWTIINNQDGCTLLEFPTSQFIPQESRNHNQTLNDENQPFNENHDNQSQYKPPQITSTENQKNSSDLECELGKFN